MTLGVGLVLVSVIECDAHIADIATPRQLLAHFIVKHFIPVFLLGFFLLCVV